MNTMKSQKRIQCGKKVLAKKVPTFYRHIVDGSKEIFSKIAKKYPLISVIYEEFLKIQLLIAIFIKLGEEFTDNLI